MGIVGWCGCGVCYELCCAICQLYSSVATFRCDLLAATLSECICLPRFARPLTRSQLQLSDMLNGTGLVPRLAFFLCCLLHPTGQPEMPTDSQALLLNIVLQRFECSASSCFHCLGELCLLPASLLGRLSRSCAVALPSAACIALFLRILVTSPIVLTQKRTVGQIQDSSCRADADADRIVTVTTSEKSLGTRVCLLSAGSKYFYVHVRVSH